MKIINHKKEAEKKCIYRRAYDEKQTCLTCMFSIGHSPICFKNEFTGYGNSTAMSGYWVYAGNVCDEWRKE